MSERNANTQYLVQTIYLLASIFCPLNLAFYIFKLIGKDTLNNAKYYLNYVGLPFSAYFTINTTIWLFMVNNFGFNHLITSLHTIFVIYYLMEKLSIYIFVPNYQKYLGYQPRDMFVGILYGICLYCLFMQSSN